jgi:hypothetical protein
VVRLTDNIAFVSANFKGYNRNKNAFVFGELNLMPANDIGKEKTNTMDIGVITAKLLQCAEIPNPDHKNKKQLKGKVGKQQVPPPPSPPPGSVPIVASVEENKKFWLVPSLATKPGRCLVATKTESGVPAVNPDTIFPFDSSKSYGEVSLHYHTAQQIKCLQMIDTHLGTAEVGVAAPENVMLPKPRHSNVPKGRRFSSNFTPTTSDSSSVSSWDIESDFSDNLFYGGDLRSLVSPIIVLKKKRKIEVIDLSRDDE